MKKIWKKGLIIVSLTTILPFVSCNANQENSNASTSENTSESTEVKTNFEIVKEFMDSFSIDNSDAIIQNIYLPKKFALEGVVTWQSSEPKVITSEGHVTRNKEKDVPVTLTAIAMLGSTREQRVYHVVVKKVNETAEGKIDEAMSQFTLLENNTIDRDIMVLPRVTDINGVYITWETSDASIIDLKGNVYRGNEEKKVTLTGTFSYGEYRKKKSFEIVVQTKADDSIPVIDENDSRILNKVYVASVVDIVTAGLDARPGDAIILRDGTYMNVEFNIERSGTAEHPIFIFAEHPGKVILSGESRINILADYVIVANFRFENGYPSKDSGVVNLEGNHLRFTNNVIKEYEIHENDYKWLSLRGRFHEIDRNTFDGKTTGGSLLTIWRDDMFSQDHHIHHNQFLNYQEAGGANGYETIRVGTSTYSQTDSNVLIENNLFENISGEIEIISIKSGRTIVRNNTFKTCKGLVTARHGKNDLIENNVFLCGREKSDGSIERIDDTGGIRMYDAGHVVRNNYMQDVETSSNTRAGIVVHSGVNDYGDTTVMNLQWTPFNVLIQDNTIINSRNSILIGGKYSIPCKDVTFDNNLVVSPTYGAIRYDKNPVNPTWINNHFYAPTYLESNSAFKDVIAPDWFSTAIPQLIKGENGLYKIAENYGASNLTVQTSETTGTNY